MLDQDFNPRALDSNNKVDKADLPPIVKNPASLGITQEKDIFGCEPFKVQDPFGMGQFTAGDLDSAIVSLDKKLAEIRVSSRCAALACTHICKLCRYFSFAGRLQSRTLCRWIQHGILVGTGPVLATCRVALEFNL